MSVLQQIAWRPTIGDPHFLGWFTVAAYALATFTCGLATRTARHAPITSAGSRGMWRLVALLMAFLCLNKQLDLQSLFTDIGRVMAHRQGWYDDRRIFQKWFVYGTVASAALITGLLIVTFRNFWRTHSLLGFGLAFLLTFIAVRAISFHHVDEFLHAMVVGVRMNWFLELTGIALVGLAAYQDYRNPLSAPAAPPSSSLPPDQPS